VLTTGRPRRVLALAAVAAVPAVGVAACSDDDDSGGGGGDVTAWCAGFDRFTAATLRLDTDRSEEALAEVQAEVDKLHDLPVPSEIADDWSAVGQPLATSETGGLQPTGGQSEAGQRVAAWAREHCDLSPEVSAALEDARG
jgi:hypothetical protein